MFIETLFRTIFTRNAPFKARSGGHIKMLPSQFASMLFFATLLLLSRLPISDASCPSFEDSPKLREEFVTSEMVARLRLIEDETMQLPCTVLVWDDAYVAQDTFPSYEIIELFKGPDNVDEIPIIWWTDTGYRETIPYFTDDDEGFLAFLNSKGRTCQNETNFWMYEGVYEPIPYEMSECSYSHNGWSRVSDEDKEWLREQAVESGGEETPSPTGDTPSPSDADEVQPTPLSDIPATSSSPTVTLAPTSTGSFVPTGQDSIFPTVTSTQVPTQLSQSTLNDEPTSGASPCLMVVVSTAASLVLAAVAML